MEILVRGILMAVAQAAPDTIGVYLSRALGPGLWKALDYKAVFFDGGRGLTAVCEWDAWVIKTSAMLPLEIASAELAFDAKALQTGVALNTQALKAGVAVNTAALETGVA